MSEPADCQRQLEAESNGALAEISNEELKARLIQAVRALESEWVPFR
jgi:hypothetical protein